MLENVDVLVFNIQDMGSRFYSYIKKMLWMQEATAENNISFIVLDRPNPIEGNYVVGPLKPNAKNGTIPITHGMTVGELAQLFNANRKENDLRSAKLTVVPMLNYKRGYWYDDTVLPWMKHLSNMLTLETTTIYPATYLIEGSNISEGRGNMHLFDPNTDYEARTLAISQIVLPSGDSVQFLETHLNYHGDNKDRMAKNKAANTLLDVESNLSILAGDLNDIPGSDPIKYLESRWSAAFDLNNIIPTFPSDAAKKEIDYVMFYPKNRWKVLEKQVVFDAIASDHCAYLVDLELLSKGSSK